MGRNPGFRKRVLERDDYNCVKCGYNPSSADRLEAHHITPLDHDGEDSVENGATLCNICHRYAPDWDTVIDPSYYPDVFEMYCTTWNPPFVDFFWFGLMAADIEFTDAEEFRGLTALEILPKMNGSNWWIILAAFADYGRARDALPFIWPEDPTVEAFQQQLSASQRL